MLSDPNGKTWERASTTLTREARVVRSCVVRRASSDFGVAFRPLARVDACARLAIPIFRSFAPLLLRPRFMILR